MKKAFITFILLLFFILPVKAAWIDENYYNRYESNITKDVMSMNVSNSTVPFQNTTHINVVCSQQNCTDLRFSRDNMTFEPMWRYQNTSDNGSGLYGIFYFNATRDGTRFQIYSNTTNPVPDVSDGDRTFLFFDNGTFGLTRWYQNAGSWTTENGYIKNIASSLDALSSSVSVNYSNVIIEGDVNPDSSGSNFQAGLGGRNQNASNGGYDYFYYDHVGTKQHLLQKAYLSNLDLDSNTWTNNVWHNNTQMRLNGQSIYASDNGFNALTASDATWSTGKIILISAWTAARGNFFDNIRVRNYTNQKWQTWSSVNYVNKIISWSNNYTNSTSTTFSYTGAFVPKLINFNVSSNFPPTQHIWYVNSVDQSNNFNNFTYSFSNPGVYNITGQIYNSTIDSYDQVVWTVTIFEVIAQTPVPDCGLRLITNNTNMAPTIEGEIPGTGERVNNVTYYNNDTAIEIMVFAHGNTVSNTAGVFLYVNGTLMLPQSGRPLGGAEVAYRSVSMIIPRGSYYNVSFANFHHYEWREYKIDLDISGCNYPDNNDSLNSVIMSMAFVIGFLVAFIVCLICKRMCVFSRDK